MRTKLALLAAALIATGMGCTASQSVESKTETVPVSPAPSTPPAEPAPTPAPEPTTAPPPTAAVDLKVQVAAKAFTVVGNNFAFDLKEIRVKKGTTVKITFKNSEGFHDWRVDEFSAATQNLQAGGQETIEFTADKTGTFEYYCAFGKHRQMGMKGNLIVE